MTTLSLRRRIAALAIAVAAVGGLTACTAPTISDAGDSGSSSSAAPEDAGADDGSGDGSDEGQTAEEACNLVQQTIESATDEFENLDAEDPTAVVEAMTAAADSIAEAATQVTNEEVAAVLPDLEEMFRQVGDVMEAIVAGDTSKIEDLSTLGTDFQETTQEFQEICAP